MANSHSRFQRRGSTYVIVLMVSSMVVLIGLTALTVARISRRNTELGVSAGESRHLAQAAVEAGRGLVANDANWRKALANGTWISDVKLGGGAVTVSGVDPDDASLSDWPRDPVVITGRGQVSPAAFLLEARLEPAVTPLDVLRATLHAGTSVSVSLSQRFAATGGPVSSNGAIVSLGTIYGNAEATLTITGTVTGTSSPLSPTKPMPPTSVVDTYIALGSALSYANLDKVVLAPGQSSLGVNNALGVYYMDTGNKDALFRRTRLHGTLIVRCTGRTLTLDTAVFFQPNDPLMATLLVDGNLVLDYPSNSTPLMEGGVRNFNPTWAPHEGVGDTDSSDYYPNEVQGLIYVTGNVMFSNGARVRGTVICGGTATCTGYSEVIHVPTIYTNPPIGFESTVTMTPKSGSWRRVLPP